MALKFTLLVSSIPVVLEGGNGKPQDYELREMTAAVRDAYLDTLGDRVQMDKDGKPGGVTKFDGLQADLVSRCLFLRVDGSKVTRETIQGWPASTVASLFDEAQKLNHLTAITEKDAVVVSKNG